jgi:hypothetical protein
MIRFRNFVKEDWNEYLHPRVPKGKQGGGRFTNKYIHYSDKPLNHLLDVPPEAQSENGMKPRGVWFGIGSSWKDWVSTEYGNSSTDIQGHFPTNKETAIVLKRNAKILRITSAKGLNEFTKKYPGEDEYLKPIKNVEYGLGRMINWKRVAKDYDGIIIAPYIASRRLSIQTPWYYGWDVASGCVWNIDAIRILK